MILPTYKSPQYLEKSKGQVASETQGNPLAVTNSSNRH